MKQQEIFKKIGNILHELNDQYEYIGNAEAQLNDLELELFVANAHFLAEHSEVLRKLNAQNQPVPAPVAPQPPKKQEEKFFEPVVQQADPEPITPPKPAEPEPPKHEDKPVPHIDLTANGADDDFSVMRRDEPGVIKHELVLDESEIWEDEDDTGFEINDVTDVEEPEPAPPVTEEKKAKTPEPVKEEAKVNTPEPGPVKPAPPVEVKKEPVTLPEITAVAEAKLEPETDEPLTINQKISAQLNKTSRLSEQLHTSTITDLKQAINLNDKLLYIRDLFNGYSLAYSEAIDLLNRCQTFTEAEEFLKSNYAVKNQWDTKQATVDKFYDLLRRRFS